MPTPIKGPGVVSLPDPTSPAVLADAAPRDDSVGDRYASPATARPFDVYFTPEENAYAFETQCIDEVIAARKSDPTSYSAEENPYRIHYMVYNLRNRDIVNKLFEAVNAGIDVQVLIEADQISPDRSWNKVDEWFEEAGLKVIRSDKDVNEARRRDAHLIGIDRKALMHMKSRIFHFKDPVSGELKSKVLSGSLNPGGAPVHSDENVNVIEDDRIVDTYDRRFYEVRAHRPTRNSWHEDRPVNVLFTPCEGSSPQPTDKLFDWIDQENEMILVSVFALHNLTSKKSRETLVEKLQAAKERGVTVMAITDRRKSDGTDQNGKRIMMYGKPAHDDPTDELLQAAGIPCFELVNTTNSTSAVHGKSVLFGLEKMKVLTGAGNWTTAAMGSNKKGAKNDESFIFVDSKDLDGNYTGRAYLGNFLNLLRKYDMQYDRAAEDVIKELQQQPGWPKVSVDLSAIAQAHEGQEVYLVSDDPALRDKIRDGEPGIRLDTSPRAGMPPHPTNNLLELPFGTRLSYRVAVRDPETGRVESSSENQILVVDAPNH